MRAFIGIEVPDQIKKNLFEIQRFIPGNLAKIKWVSKKNFHITLKFFRSINEEKLEKIKENLKKITFNPFELQLDNLGFFSHNGKLRVIRLTFTNEKDIISLQQKIDSELLDSFSEDQKFSPHLTLGRRKFIKNKKEFLEKINKFNFTNDTFKVTKFKLIESKLTKDGPKYKILEEFKS